MNVPVLGTLLAGGVAALDATPLAQTLLSQPLVTATALGILWGDWPTALAVGTVLQILAASTLPVGSRTPEDYAVGGVAGAGVALVIASQAPFEHMRQAASFTGVMTGMIAASLQVPVLRWQRWRNEGLARWCERALREGHEGALAQAQWAGLSLAFALGLAAVGVWLAAGQAMAPFVGRESLRIAGVWNLLQPLWLGFGFAQLLNAFVQRRLERAGVFAAALVSAWLVIVAGSP